MVRHVVMFKLKEDLDPTDKQEAMECFQKGIMSLPAKIPYIRSIEVGFNVNPTESWDICLNSLFDSLDDVVAYGINPAHVAVASALKPKVLLRGCVDFEI